MLHIKRKIVYVKRLLIVVIIVVIIIDKIILSINL